MTRLREGAAVTSTGGHLLVWSWGAVQQGPGLWQFIICKRDHSLSFGFCLNFLWVGGGRGREETHPKFQVMELHYVGSTEAV